MNTNAKNQHSYACVEDKFLMIILARPLATEFRTSESKR